MSPKPAPSSPPDAGRTRKELLSELHELRVRNAALEEREERYRELVENANSIIIRWDMQGNLTFINEFAEKLFGFSKNEVLGRNVVGTIVPLSESTGRDLAAMIEDVLRYPERYMLNVNENVCKNGERVSIAWTNKAIYDDRGNAVEILSVGNDITERRRAEESLQFERLQLLSIFDSVDEVIYVADPYTYEILYANKAMQEKFGKSLIGGTCYREILDRNAPCEFCTNDIILHNKGEPCRWEFHNPTVDRDFGIVDRIIKWPDGRNVRFEIALDITERRQAEEALKLTQFALDNFGDSSIWLTMDGSLVYVNQGTCKSLGYSRDELLSMHIWDIDPDYSPDTFRELWPKTKAHGHYLKFESRHVNRDGRAFPVEVTCCYTRYGDKEYLVTFDRDITGRKQAEEALRESEENSRAAFEQAAVGMTHVSRDGRFMRVNQKFCSITGYTREELVKTKAGDITYPADMPEEVRLIERLLAGEISTFSSEKRYVRKDGAIVWVNLTVTPIFHNGALTYLMGITEDITERKRAEEALQDAKAQAELYVDLMGHDINNIHQSALGYLELARDMPGDAREEYLDMAMEALMRSTRLIGNVRKLQKIRDSRRAHYVDVCAVLGEVYDEYAKSAGKTITLNLNDHTHCYVRADDLLRDVFSNLVGNAVKHTGNHARVSIGLDKVRAEGAEYYRVMVEDDGPGVRDELKKTLFSRSLKGTPRAKGMGLGLYIVKTLVRNYGGLIRVEDRVQGDHSKGARFVVMLPAAKQ